MEKVIEYRRELHKIPELARTLPKTCAFVEDTLRRFGFEPFSPCESALCVYIDMGQPETTAFRADMDALPVTEETGAEYQSTHKGKMHACGHDCHTAVLLGFAEWLSKCRIRLPSNVLLIFQPAEEALGGAEGIVKDGLFEKYNVKRVFGLHVAPGMPTGEVRTLPGPMLAGACRLTLTVRGRGCHITSYRQGVDPIWGAARLLSHLYPIAEERDDLILRFAMLNCGTAPNVIADTAELQGSARYFCDEALAHARNALRDAAEKMEAETGCTLEITERMGAGAVVNDEELVRLITEDAELKVKLLPGAMPGSEDFSVYQRLAPGVFFALGVGDTEPLHSPRFSPDEKALAKGVELFISLAKKF